MKLTFLDSKTLGVLEGIVMGALSHKTQRTRASECRRLVRIVTDLRLVMPKDGPVHYVSLAVNTSGDTGLLVVQDSNEPDSITGIEHATLPQQGGESGTKT